MKDKLTRLLVSTVGHRRAEKLIRIAHPLPADIREQEEHMWMLTDQERRQLLVAHLEPRGHALTEFYKEWLEKEEIDVPGSTADEDSR